MRCCGQGLRVVHLMRARCGAFVFAIGLGCKICCADKPPARAIYLCVVEPERVVLAGLPRVECVDAESGALLRTPGTL
jgi:hypothetical protein